MNLILCMLVVGVCASCPGKKWILLAPPRHVALDSVVQVIADSAEWCAVAVSPEPLERPAPNVDVLDPAALPPEVAAPAAMLNLSSTVANLRTLAVLYAVARGATHMFEMNSSIELTYLPSVLIKPTMYFFANTTFNPYAYFGQPSVWPRGWPLSRVGEAAETTGLTASDVRTRREPLIHHTLTNGVPELDATFRLTRVVHGGAAAIEFAPRVPLCAVGMGYFPLHDQATLYTQDALWAAVPPGDTEDADVIRGYWAQRVVRELGGAVAIHGPVTRRNTTAAVPAAWLQRKAARELQQHVRLDRLTAFLDAWRVPAAATDACAVGIALAKAMATGRYWTDADAMQVTSFMAALKASGYHCPPRKGRKATALVAMRDTRFTVQPRGAVLALPGEGVVPWDVTALQAETSMRWRHAMQLTENSSRIYRIPAYTHTVAPTPTRVPCASLLANPAATVVPRILMVVNFHFFSTIHLDSVRFMIDAVFAHYFNTPFDVVFVGPGDGVPGVLGNGLPEAGFFSYHSLTVAHRRYPGYDGYFLVNDDSLLVQEMFEPARFAWRWQYPWTVGDHFEVCRPNGWWPWEPYCGAALNAYMHKCGKHYRGDPGCVGGLGIYAGQSDMFYVPGRLMDVWDAWSDVMTAEKVFLELAVPTILQAISDVHCDTGARVLGGDLFLDVCTAYDHTRQDLWRKMTGVAAQSDAHCAAYHPIKLSSQEVRDAIKAYYERMSATRCLKSAAACTLVYVPDSDGFLWRVQPTQ